MCFSQVGGSWKSHFEGFNERTDTLMFSRPAAIAIDRSAKHYTGLQCLRTATSENLDAWVSQENWNVCEKRFEDVQIASKIRSTLRKFEWP